jgi:hypothetical protein
MNTLKKGDYVLATKWGDGDPHDHWCVGFFAGKTAHDVPRYDVVDENGRLFRGNGFRRCEKISLSVGEYILAHKQEIMSAPFNESLGPDKSIWAWKDMAISESCV